MKLRFFILILLATASAEEKKVDRPARAPRGQIKYNDSHGTKVNWKYFNPENRFRSKLESSQSAGDSPRQHRAEHETVAARQPQKVQHQPVALAQADPNQEYYKPFSSVPAPIKQLIFQAYQPQPAYVNPSAFIYGSHFVASPHDQQSATAEISSGKYEEHSGQGLLGQQKYPIRRDHGDRRSRLQGKIEYTDDYADQKQRGRQFTHINVPIEVMPVPPAPQLLLDKNMPTEIQQLLQYQAQIPYDVTANRILYKPKKIFVPSPLPEIENVRGPYQYRSKIYYMKNDEIDPEYETSTASASRH